MRYDLTTIGEGQIRLTCERGDRLATARSLRMTAAGSEANVAGLLSELGRSTAWTTKLPRGELADRIALEYSAVGVDMSHVVLADEGRVALYFLEPGEFPLPGKVTYDCQYTPFRSITPDDFDWDTAMARLATLPRQAEWEAYTSRFQAVAPGQTSNEKWQMMERMFHLYDK